MDEKVKLLTPMEANVAPVIVMNKFSVKPDEVDKLLKIWAADAAIMKRQPGFISTQLHRGIVGSCVFIHYAVWESTEHYERAYNNPELVQCQGISRKHRSIPSPLQESCNLWDLCRINLYN
jgi:heme-degrading monooxygenase HmoA